MGGIELSRWRLRNFKSVREADVELSNLTLLVGANSAGKSSLIQSILAVNQAIGTFSDLYPLNGSTVRLGTVDEVKHRGPLSAADDHIEFGAEFVVSTEGPSRRSGNQRMRRSLGSIDGPLLASWSLELSQAPFQQSGRAQIEQVRMKLDRAKSARSAGEPTCLGDLKVLARHDDVASAGPVSDPVEQRIPRVFAGSYEVENGTTLEVVESSIVGGFPVNALVLRDRAQTLFETWVSTYQNMMISFDEESDDQLKLDEDEMVALAVDDMVKASNAHLASEVDFERLIRTDLSGMFSDRAIAIDWNAVFSPSFRDQAISRLRDKGVSGEVPVFNQLGHLGATVSAVAEFFRDNIRYLGPLREDPRVVYQDSPESGNGYVGPKGEFCAAVLQRAGSAMVRVPMPSGKVETTSLSLAVNEWANYLDIGSSFSASDQGRFGLQMQVTQSDVGIPLDLTSVGTGVSQLLPVLVMCLQAPSGCLLMMEQPELHLNPRVQQRLADFLLAIAMSGRRLIVETHSEYLISRLRLHVAQDEGDMVRQAIGILFAERVDGSTTYRKVETNEFGAVENWPNNFFDQSAEETHKILSAAVQKRRRQLVVDKGNDTKPGGH